MVRFVKGPNKPAVVAAIDLMVLIGHPKVPENPRPGRLGGPNGGASMKQASGLVKVDCPLHVVGNNAILLTRFSNTVNLYRQPYLDTLPSQVSGQCDCLGSTPAVAINDDPCLLSPGV